VLHSAEEFVHPEIHASEVQQACNASRSWLPPAPLLFAGAALSKPLRAIETAVTAIARVYHLQAQYCIFSFKSVVTRHAPLSRSRTLVEVTFDSQKNWYLVVFLWGTTAWNICIITYVMD
jgi:hypothetical protein